MYLDNLVSVATTLGGGFFVSFLVGYFVKKMIKILMFVSGAILALLLYLQSEGIINVEVNVDKIQTSAQAAINSITTQLALTFPIGNTLIADSNLGIPLTGSIASGFMLGVTRRG
jgi:uncharacterized membrane protein (Fun14 family)